MPGAFDFRALVNPSVSNYTEQVYTPLANSAFTVNLINGTIQILPTNGNCTVTLPLFKGKSYTIVVAYGGVHTLTWAGGGTLRWSGGTTPTPTSVANKFDVFTFLCDGVNTLGFTGGLNF